MHVHTKTQTKQDQQKLTRDTNGPWVSHSFLRESLDSDGHSRSHPDVPVRVVHIHFELIARSIRWVPRHTKLHGHHAIGFVHPDQHQHKCLLSKKNLDILYGATVTFDYQVITLQRLCQFNKTVGLYEGCHWVFQQQQIISMAKTWCHFKGITVISFQGKR